MPLSDPFFIPRRKEGPATMYLWVFYRKPEACIDVQRAGGLMY